MNLGKPARFLGADLAHRDTALFASGHVYSLSQPVSAAFDALEHYGIRAADLANAARFAKFGAAAFARALLPDGLLVVGFLRNNF